MFLTRIFKTFVVNNNTMNSQYFTRSWSQSYQTFFLRLRSIFLFTAEKLGHFMVNGFEKKKINYSNSNSRLFKRIEKFAGICEQFAGIRGHSQEFAGISRHSQLFARWYAVVMKPV